MSPAAIPELTKSEAALFSVPERSEPPIFWILPSLLSFALLLLYTTPVIGVSEGIATVGS